MHSKLALSVLSACLCFCAGAASVGFAADTAEDKITFQENVAGNPAMRENLPPEPFVPQAKRSAVVAMASSPWAPLVAVAGHKQVLLYRTTDHHLVGVLPFAEGLIYVLKFSRDGDLLLAGG